MKTADELIVPRLWPNLAAIRLLRVLVVACAIQLGTPLLVQAGERPHKSRAALESDLASSDTATALAAVDGLGELDASAVAPLSRFVRAGQPDALTDRALAALGNTRSPSALDTLAEFTHHRRSAARIAAYTAIARIAGARSDELLAQGLRDSESAVRGACARKLGERNARAQIESLLRAFERGVPEAAAAVGRIADEKTIARFHAQIGRAPIQLMLAGYEPLLLRSDIGQALKLDVIARLGEVASISAKRFLERMRVEHDWAAQPALLHALSDTARRIEEKPPVPAQAPVPVSPNVEAKP